MRRQSDLYRSRSQTALPSSRGVLACLAFGVALTELTTGCGGGSSGGGAGGGAAGTPAAGAGGGAGASGGVGGQSPPGGAGGEPSPTAMAPGACGPLPPAPIRRLSRIEYVGTLRELFPFAFTPDSDGVWRIDDHQLSFQRGNQKISWIWKDDNLADPDTFGFANRANNLNPTSALIESRDDSAITVSEYVIKQWRDGKAKDFLPCSETTVACAKTWLASFAPRAYRRPLEDDEKKDLEDFLTATFEDASKVQGVNAFEASLRLTLQVLLASPAFQYRLEVGDPATKKDGAIKLTQYEIANRLSYLFWSTMPDQTLLDAAAKNELSTPEQLEAQARRLIADNRFRYMATEWFRQWGDLERIFVESDRIKPGASITAPNHSFEIMYLLAAREEASRFGEWVMAEGGASPADIFGSTTAYTNNYADQLLTAGVPFSGALPAPGPWKKTQLKASERAGFLTRPFFAWAYSHEATPNPPIRGSFVMSKVFCSHLGPPPANAQTLAGAVKFTAGMTNRDQFVARRQADKSCETCHKVMDPLGFAFENYNQFGRYIANDEKSPSKKVDASGQLMLGSDIDGPFADGLELSQKLGTSATVRQCMMQQWYEYATGRDVTGSLVAGDDGPDKCRLETLDKAVADHKGDLREGLIALVKTPDFVWRPAY